MGSGTVGARAASQRESNSAQELLKLQLVNARRHAALDRSYRCATTMLVLGIACCGGSGEAGSVAPQDAGGDARGLVDSSAPVEGGPAMDASEGSTDAFPDGAVDAVPPSVDSGDSSGPAACGTMTCGPTQFCVHPCCGASGQPLCWAPTDAGTCPVGYSPVNDFCGPGFGCVSDQCMPVPRPHCVDTPPQCSTCAAAQQMGFAVCTTETCSIPVSDGASLCP
jgi:hypothetical protein